MKKINLIMPIAAISAITPTISMVACTSNKELELAMSSYEGEQEFCCTGNFNTGTTYDIKANLSKWTDKPETGTETISEVSLLIYNNDKTQKDFINNAKITVTCDGKTVQSEISRSTEDNTIFISLTKPVKKNATIVFKNINVTSNFSGAFVLISEYEPPRTNI